MRDCIMTKTLAKQEMNSHHDPNLGFDLAKFL